MALTTAFRIADWMSPLRVRGNRSEGRFNRPGQTTQYLCLHPLGPWAEFVRRERPPGALLGEFRHRLWALRIDLDEALHIDFDSAPDLGVQPDELVGDAYEPCQVLADRLRAEGVTTFVVPSAALEGTRNVVVLAPRAPAPYGVAPIDAIDVPASVAAEDATIPTTLPSVVRHPGAPHAELEAWRNGEPYVFVEPPMASA